MISQQPFAPCAPHITKMHCSDVCGYLTSLEFSGLRLNNDGHPPPTPPPQVRTVKDLSVMNLKNLFAREDEEAALKEEVSTQPLHNWSCVKCHVCDGS